MKTNSSLLLSFALFCSFGFFQATAWADSLYDPDVIGDIFPVDGVIPDFSPEQRQFLGRAFGTYTTATTVFTGLNSASGGALSFDGRDGDRDGLELDIYRLPLNYTFGEEGDKVRLALRGVIGRFSGTSSAYFFSDELAASGDALPQEIRDLPNLPDFVRETATSLGGGFGVQIEALKGLTITPAFDLIWTHLRSEYDYNNFLSAFIGAKYDRELFNTSVEAISYVPSIKVAYKYDITDCFAILPNVEYSYLRTTDLWSKSSLADFTTNAEVLRTTIEAAVKTPWEVAKTPVSVHPYVIRTDLGGAAKDGLGFSYFHDVGLDVAFATGARGWWLSEVRVGGAYIFNDYFDGYRFGFNAKL